MVARQLLLIPCGLGRSSDNPSPLLRACLRVFLAHGLIHCQDNVPREDLIVVDLLSKSEQQALVQRQMQTRCQLGLGLAW